MMSNEVKDKKPASGQLVRELYFPTYIYFKDLPAGAALNVPLRQAIYAARTQDSVGLHRSNVKQVGAWHSQDELHRHVAFETLNREILAALQEVFDDLGYDPDYEPCIDNMWANISPKHAFNRTHIHPGVIYSGVYYVQSPPKCGRIFFSDPRVQAQMLRPRINADGKKEGHNWTEVFFQALEGRLILFPAWLTHEVEPNLADYEGDAGDRISISFNVIQRYREADSKL